MAYGMFLAREFGDDQLYAKISGYTETRNEPIWDEATGEFHWRLGLDEPTPRGQLNAAAAMAEANSLKGWSNLFATENLKKFVDPTIHGVDFPTMCLSQASFDTERRTLVAASDAGVPANAGQSTTFRVGNVPPGACSMEIDGKQSSDWRAICSTMRIVVPPARRLSMTSKGLLTSCGARPREGSSMSRRLGRDMSPRAMASICCSPPDSVPARWLRRSIPIRHTAY